MDADTRGPWGDSGGQRGPPRTRVDSVPVLVGMPLGPALQAASSAAWVRALGSHGPAQEDPSGSAGRGRGLRDQGRGSAAQGPKALPPDPSFASLAAQRSCLPSALPSALTGRPVDRWTQSSEGPEQGPDGQSI